MTYSVLTEPVIPVIMPDGTQRAVGIREAFLRAHEIADIRGRTPLERYALLRLLVAFAMDMLHPQYRRDRKKILNAGRFSSEAFEEYVSMCNADGERFDLFDEKYPFYQCAYDEKLDADARAPIAMLYPYWPTGNNHMFFDHRYEGEHSIPCDQALSALCMINLFCCPVGAQKIPSGVNKTTPIYATIIGNNLLETIVMNMLSQAEAGNLPYGVGDVPWRNKKVIIPKTQASTVSLLEGMTLQPRRIKLISGTDETIEEVYFQAGVDFRGNNLWRDPHVPYSRDVKTGALSTVKPSYGRRLWRNVGSLLYSEHCQPQVVRYAQDMMEEKYLNIRLLGLATSEGAKYDGWYEDELSIPQRLLTDLDGADMFREDIDYIERIQKLIQYAVKLHFVAKGDEKKVKTIKASPAIAVQAQEFFLHLAHKETMGQMMEDISTGSEPAKHVAFVKDILKILIRQTMQECIRKYGTNRQNLMTEQKAEDMIWTGFAKMMKEREDQYAE